MSALIYKICPEVLWQAAETAGRFDGAPVDIADGFIHFSTAEQLRETAARHFDGEAGLLLVAVEADALGDALRWEPSRGGALFFRTSTGRSIFRPCGGLSRFPSRPAATMRYRQEFREPG